MSPNISVMPTTWARSMNFSLGGRRRMISAMRNNTWPPSKAGIGRMFMKASIRLRKAVVSQKVSQSHVAGKMLPMVMKLPTLLAPSAVKTYCKSLT